MCKSPGFSWMKYFKSISMISWTALLFTINDSGNSTIWYTKIGFRISIAPREYRCLVHISITVRSWISINIQMKLPNAEIMLCLIFIQVERSGSPYVGRISDSHGAMRISVCGSYLGEVVFVNHRQYPNETFRRRRNVPGCQTLT